MLRACLLAVTFAVAAQSAAFACSQPAGAAQLENAMVAWINDQRQANGLPALKKSSKLAASAQGHACDMAERGFFAHQRAGGPDLAARLRQEGYRYRAAVENIAKVRPGSVGNAAELWRNSSGHWRNILNAKVTEVGIGIASAGGRDFWVMNAGRSK